MKKVVVWALVLVTLCLSFGSAQTKYPLAGGKKFTYWASLPANVNSYAKNLGDVPFRQNLEKRTGVKIEYLHPAAGSDLEQLNIIFASGDYPDMLEYTWPSYSGGTAKLYSAGVIQKLNTVIDKWMPNLKAYYAANPHIARQVKSDDGGFYLIPFIRGSDELRFTSGPTLRADWLAANKLKVPETISEWETVLTAFKDKNGAVAPFAGSMTELTRVFITAFDTSSNNFYPRGNTVYFSPLDPGYKEFLTKMSEWYAKGLIDKNLMTVDRKYIDAAMTNGKAGSAYCAGGGQVGPYIINGKKALETFDLVAAKTPVAKLGQKPKYINSFEFTSNGHVVITTACKDTEAAAKWLDYAYGKEGNLFFNFGIEGESFNFVNGEPIYSDLVLKNPDKLSIAQAMSKYSVAPLSGPFVQALGYIQQFYTMPQQKNALKMWSTKDETTTVLPPVTFTVAEGQEVAQIMIDINTYIDEMRAKFILGTEPLANLDKFQATIKSMGIDKALKIYQTAFERYNKR